MPTPRGVDPDDRWRHRPRGGGYPGSSPPRRSGPGTTRWYFPPVDPRARPTARTASHLLGAGGGALLLGATFVPWTARGAGSTVPTRNLADLVLAGTVAAWAPRWSGLVVYLIPAGGALLLIGTGMGPRIGTGLAALGSLLALVITIVAAWAIARGSRPNVGPGTVLAAVGSVLGLAAVAAAARAAIPPSPTASPEEQP